MTVLPCAPVARGRSSMPCLRAPRGLEPMSVSLSLQPLAEARVHGLAHQAHGLEVAEHVPSEEPLRQRRLARADGEMDLVRPDELLGDLVARVAAADDQRRARREVGR